jgi:hypothetical protein
MRTHTHAHTQTHTHTHTRARAEHTQTHAAPLALHSSDGGIHGGGERAAQALRGGLHVRHGRTGDDDLPDEW